MPFGKLIEATVISGYIEHTNDIPDNVLREMGFDKTYMELLKYVPRKPVNQSYAPCDFTTYAKCPGCGGVVIDGMGGTNDKCSCCVQMLKW